MDARPYKRYLLGLLLVIFAFNQVDRLALGLVLQDIKLDLSLTDTQLGFLSGLAFAVFYSVLGIPIARWADRGNRVLIIASTTTLWSAAVALCGAATSLVQLLLIRAAVAVGEAGCIPPAHSLIADYFGRRERPRAVALYMLGAPLSMVIGYFLAGWLNEFYGWRTMFVMLGLPGLLLGSLAFFTLREPRLLTRAAPASTRAPEVPVNAHPDLRTVCVTLWANVTFRSLLVSFAVSSFFGSGIGQWQPAYFIRTYALPTGELGTWFTLIYGVGGLLGTYCGGLWASRRAANDERLQLQALALMYASFAVVSVFIYLSPNRYVAFALMALVAFGGSSASGPLFATIQTLVPARMRALSIALIFFFANLVGMGLGPLAAGALSDALRAVAGEASLRYALLILCPGYALGGWYLWRASRTVMRDLQASTDLRDCVASTTSPLERSGETADARVPPG